MVHAPLFELPGEGIEATSSGFILRNLRNAGFSFVASKSRHSAERHSLSTYEMPIPSHPAEMAPRRTWGLKNSKITTSMCIIDVTETTK